MKERQYKIYVPAMALKDTNISIYNNKTLGLIFAGLHFNLETSESPRPKLFRICAN